MLMNRLDNQRGGISVILAGVFGLLSVLLLVFGVWAFSERSTYKNDVDKIVADEVAIAKQAAETAKDAEFVELEKAPNRTYTGSETYGSFQFSYPKTWSLYEEEGRSGSVLSVYGFPGIVPGTSSDRQYAIRLEITSKTYDSELSAIQRDIESGKVTADAYRPDRLPDVLGTRVSGEIQTGINGSMVLLPLRDKTIKIYTESSEFLGDFTNIVLPSINYIP